jgi:hypothetical protein
MQGHGYTQPVKQPPHTGWLVFLRVLFVVISIFSIGLLAWTMLLRLAIVTRKPLDWGLFVAVIVADVLALVLLGTEPGDEVHTVGGWTGMALLLGTLVAAIAYYLAADIRHFHQLRYGGYAAAPAPTQAYGYPQPATPSPYAMTAVPQTPQPPQAPHTPPSTPPTPVPQPLPPTTPPPQRPAPARIDQVRAELDELSDYLRNHDGHHDGNHEGGR